MSQSVSARVSHWPLTLLSGVGSLLNLILPLFLVRLLPPDQVGQYKVFFLYLVLIPWLGLTAGIPNGLAYWAGQSQSDRFLRASWTLLLVQSALIVTTLFIFWTSTVRLDWVPFDREVSLLFFAGLMMTLVGGFYEETCIARGDVLRGALTQSGFEVLRNLSLLTAAFLFRDVFIVFLAFAIASTVKASFTLVMGYRSGLQRLELDPEALRAVARYSFPVSLSAVFLVGIQYFDQLYLSKHVDPASFALYTFGCLVIPPLLIFEQAVNKVLIPQLSRALAAHEVDKARSLFQNASSELAWLLYPAATGLILFAEGIVTLLFTETYLEAAQYLRIYALSHVLSSIPYDALWRAQGKGREILKHIGAFSVLSVLGVWAGFSAYGMKGALVGFLLSAGLMRTSAFLRSAHGVEKNSLRWVPVRDLLRYLVVLAFLSLITVTFRAFVVPQWSEFQFFLVVGPIFGVSYVVLTVGLFLRRRSQLLKRKRVLMLTQYLGLGGLERMILNLATELKSKGEYEPMVYVYESDSSGPSLHADFERSGITVISNQKAKRLSFRTAREIAVFLIRNQILVLHSHDLGALIYGVLAKGFSLGAVRLVHTQHSFVHLERSPRYKWYERFFSHFADRLITVSEPLREQYATVGISPTRVTVVPNGIPVVESAHNRSSRRSFLSKTPEGASSEFQELEKRIDDVWVLCMARIHPRKGQDHVLKLWSQYETESSKGTLILMGAETQKGELARVLSLRSSLREPERVIYAGFTLEPQAWLGISDIWISGSEFEGMPLAPVEALLSGCRVLVSDIPGHRALPAEIARFRLDDLSTGVLHLKKLIEGREGEISATTKSRLRSEYGVENMARRYSEAYDY